MLPGFFTGLSIGLFLSSIVMWVAAKKYRMATQMFNAATEEYTRAKEMVERFGKKV